MNPPKNAKSMTYYMLPDKDAVTRWLIADGHAEGHKINIPVGHSNAFLGLLRTPWPTPILDEEIVIQNLLRQGMSEDEIVSFIEPRSVVRQDGQPMIARKYNYDFSLS